MFTAGIDNLLLEENFFDHNGWNDQISGAEKTIFNHSVYVHDLSGPATFIGNITANASSFGIEQRSGGVTTDNLMFGNSIGIEYGSTESATCGPLMHDSTATDNVIVENVDTQWGFMVYPDTASKITIQSNNHRARGLAEWQRGRHRARGRIGECHGDRQHHLCLGPSDPGRRHEQCGLAQRHEGHRLQRPRLSVSRTLGRILRRHDRGAGTAADFDARARRQSKDNWDPALMAKAVNDYIRAGFNM